MIILHHAAQQGDKIVSPGFNAWMVNPMTAWWIGSYKSIGYLPFRSAGRRPVRLKDFAILLIDPFLPSKMERKWGAPAAVVAHTHSSGCCAGAAAHTVRGGKLIVVPNKCLLAAPGTVLAASSEGAERLHGLRSEALVSIIPRKMRLG